MTNQIREFLYSYDYNNNNNNNNSNNAIIIIHVINGFATLVLMGNLDAKNSGYKAKFKLHQNFFFLVIQ